MVKPKPPKEPSLGERIKEFCSSGFLTIIRLIALILIIVSGYFILAGYYNILCGNIPNDVQKMSLDYSFTIFAGSAIYLLAYTAEVEVLVKKIFYVKDVKKI